MDLFRRMGTQKKKFKVQFFIGRLKFSSYIKGKIYIVLKRGNHKVKSQQQLQMSKDLKVNFNKQILQMQNTLYFDQKTNKHLQKLGQLKVVLLTQQNQKILLGVVKFDVAKYADNDNSNLQTYYKEKQQSMKQKKQLEQTPKKLQGLIQFNLFVKYIGQGSVSSFDKVQDFFFGKQKNKKDQINNNKISHNSLKEDINIKSDSKIKSSNTPKQIQSENKMRRTLSPQNDIDDDFNNSSSKYKKNNKNKFYYNADQEQNQITQNHKSSKNIQQKNIKQSQQLYKNTKKLQQNHDCSIQPQIINNNQKMILQIQLWKHKHDQKQKQNKKYQKQLQKLKKQLSSYQQKNSNLTIQLKQKSLQLIRLRQQRQRQTIIQKSNGNQNQQLQHYENLVKKLQKQKNEHIVQISKLKQKHKNQLKKYQQQLNFKKQDQSSDQIQLKIFNQKLRQQNNQYKQRVFMLTKQKDQKTIQLNKHKTQKRSMQDELAQVKSSLSKIKIKICNLINESLTKGENNLAEVLTTLTQE